MNNIITPAVSTICDMAETIYQYLAQGNTQFEVPYDVNDDYNFNQEAQYLYETLNKYYQFEGEFGLTICKGINDQNYLIITAI